MQVRIIQIQFKVQDARFDHFRKYKKFHIYTHIKYNTSMYLYYSLLFVLIMISGPNLLIASILMPSNERVPLVTPSITHFRQGWNNLTYTTYIHTYIL